MHSGAALGKVRMIAAAGAVLAFAVAAPTAATTSVIATVSGFQATTAVTWTVVNPSPPNSSRQVLGGRIEVSSTGSTAPYTFLGGSLADQFVAFCIEPLELVPVGTPVTYSVVPLSDGASGLGGIGTDRANRIRELFGRFAPDGGFATMTGAQGVAFQLAIWEIVMETTGNALAVGSRDLNRGRFFVSASVAATTAIASANSMLGQLNGTGPLADGLFALRNGTLDVPGSQDLLVFATVAPPPPPSAVPEPASWAMLIAGFGLTGAALRRRRARAAA